MTNRMKSAASLRASTYPNRDGQWLCKFNYNEAKGLGRESGVDRRDPSSIIQVDKIYYVYYTRSEGVSSFDRNNEKDKKFPWDFADIWYATSRDGINWEEKGCVVHRGEKGSYDDRTVCTPDVLAFDGKYYLVYQCISTTEFYTGGNEKVGMAISDSPEGPFVTLNSAILAPAETTDLFNEKDTYNTGDFYGTCHDPFLMRCQGKYFLYYKCGSRRSRGRGPLMTYAGRDTRWGVAISDQAEGPYIPSEFNPITNSGHETLLWNYKGGVAALLNRDGPEANTVQYAADGINFEIMSVTQLTPEAGGAFIPQNGDGHPLDGLRWGLCHVDEKGGDWNYIYRFTTEEGQADVLPENHPPHLYKAHRN